MYRIFMIEDDEGILEALKTLGARWDLRFYGVKNYRNILSEFAELQPHLVVMDIGLPYYDGYRWCAELRKRSDVPILFLSAASESMNMVMAMNMGGDDFVAKPFDCDVLIAKIQALLRRTYDYVGNQLLLEHRGARLNAANGTLIYNDVPIELTKNELRILSTLLERKGEIVSRECLMDALWASDCYIDGNTLSVNVNRLRKKLEAHGLSDFIRTKFGVGYYIGEAEA